MLQRGAGTPSSGLEVAGGRLFGLQDARPQVVASRCMLRVRVPASSANLGPGFDALGLSLGLFLEVEAWPAAEDAFDYRGAGPAPVGADNLIHQGFKAVH